MNKNQKNEFREDLKKSAYGHTAVTVVVFIIMCMSWGPSINSVSQVKPVHHMGVEFIQRQPREVESAAKPKSVKKAEKKVNQIERQVDQIRPVTKTASATVIHTKKEVGSRRQVSHNGEAVSMKPKAKVPAGVSGVLSESNAQVLSARSVVSSGKKIVQTGKVKKSKEQLQVAQAKQDQEKKKAKQKADEEKQRQEAEQKRQAQERAHYEASQITKYGQMIISHIQGYTLFTEGMGKLSVRLKIKLSTEGVVDGVGVIDSSGNASFDQLALNAVYKASPLPLPPEKDIREKMAAINLTIKPEALSQPD